MSDATNMGIGQWFLRIVLSVLLGGAAYYLLSGFNPGDMSIANAFDNHGWDGLFQTVSFRLGSTISPLSFEMRAGICGGFGVLMLIWRGFWDWFFGSWF